MKNETDEDIMSLGLLDSFRRAWRLSGGRLLLALELMYNPFLETLLTERGWIAGGDAGPDDGSDA